MTSDAAPVYRERLWPSVGMFLATILLIPAALLTFLPISIPVGIAAAVILFIGANVVLVLTSPRVEVTTTELRAGAARLPLEIVDSVHAFNGPDAVSERGVRLDARAWMLLRGWASGVVRIHLNDPEDPVPYWLISSRRPEQLAAALESARPKRSAPSAS